MSLQLLTHVISLPQHAGLLKINPDIVTPPPSSCWWLPLFPGNTPLWSLRSRDSDMLTCKYPAPWDSLHKWKGWQSDQDYSLACINCVLFLFLMKGSWRLGGQVEQSHKTNPIIQERFVPLSDFQTIPFSFCLLWNNFSAPLQKAQTFVFGGCLCSKSFLALFCTCCCSHSWGWSLFLPRMNHLQPPQLKFLAGMSFHCKQPWVIFIVLCEICLILIEHIPTIRLKKAYEFATFILLLFTTNLTLSEIPW